jgi:hypothetical protein
MAALAAAMTSAAASGVTSTPTSPSSSVAIAITDLSGAPVRRTRVGQVLRFEVVPKQGATLSKWMRVCVERGNGNYCAPPSRPHVLVRRVRASLVVDGRVRAKVIRFTNTTLVTKSIPVVG